MHEIVKKASDDADFEKVLFVIRAISDDATRPHMCVLHVERTKTGSRLVGTDGRRLHVSEIAERILPGDYETVATKTSVILRGPIEGISYPNWKRVVPSQADERGLIDLSGAGLSRKAAQCADMSIAFSRIMMHTGAVVNLRFLEDLPKKEMKVLSGGGKGKPILFKRDEGGRETLAVIMPLDVDEANAA